MTHRQIHDYSHGRHPKVTTVWDTTRTIICNDDDPAGKAADIIAELMQRLADKQILTNGDVRDILHLSSQCQVL